MRKLDQYQSKRNTAASGEPSGGGSRKSAEKPCFVIQKHDASSLHYDFRLEAGGVLKSWAVPKGPSTDPKDKRLAVLTEDHPLDYADFEGSIPEGHYGAGRVIVWDTGTYRNLTTDEDEREVALEDAVENGHVKVFLEGEKIRGGYALIRMKTRQDWLLIKVDDEYADARRKPTSTQPESVKSGKT
ncbi:MAG: DNA ligase, partial [Candidatus Eremiobacteraeota bacterium]|nr:DNA ligase [Candidatus Eremiobacteraeota bacterium]